MIQNSRTVLPIANTREKLAYRTFISLSLTHSHLLYISLFCPLSISIGYSLYLQKQFLKNIYLSSLSIYLSLSHKHIHSHLLYTSLSFCALSIPIPFSQYLQKQFHIEHLSRSLSHTYTHSHLLLISLFALLLSP